jgi:hypothetical protein
MYEHHRHRLLPWPAFLRRAVRHVAAAGAIVAVMVSAGTSGYHLFARLPWIDAFLNASMILSGMGPVDHLDTAVAKLFAAFYALFSGLVFVAVMGIILGPWVHRLFHWMHLEDTPAGDT